MTFPWIKLYTSDWRGSAKLSRCNHEQRGIWLEVICLLHESSEYGVLRWPLEDIARAIGTTEKKLRKLQEFGLLKGAAAGTVCKPLTYTPSTGRTRGPTVVLIEEQPGDIWYCSRLVRDEHVRRRKAGTSEAPNPSPMHPSGEGMSDTPNPSPSSRAGAPSQKPETRKEESKALVADVPSPPTEEPTRLPGDCPHFEIIAAYHRELPMLSQVSDWTEPRRVCLRARWREKPERQSVDWWVGFFRYVAACPFLVGNHNSRTNPNFQADLEWLVRPSNFLKVIEGKYEDRNAVAPQRIAA